MGKIAILHIERLPEKVYLATSDDIPGLVAQGKTLSETIKNAELCASDLYEVRKELGWDTQINTITTAFTIKSALIKSKTKRFNHENMHYFIIRISTIRL